jgi:polyhydroxybutyrate depolymerase
MTYLLSCRMPERLAAIAPALMQVSRAIVQDCSDATPLPLMIVTGTADFLVPETGTTGIVSTADNIAFWKSRNKIHGDPKTAALADPVTEMFRGKPAPSHILRHIWAGSGDNEIIWLEVVNGGHVMPMFQDGKATDPATLPGPPPSNDMTFLGHVNEDYDAALGIYEFLLSHKRRH